VLLCICWLPQITAMQVAALKKLSKGTTVYLLDRNGSSSKAGSAWVLGKMARLWQDLPSTILSTILRRLGYPLPHQRPLLP